MCGHATLAHGGIVLTHLVVDNRSQSRPWPAPLHQQRARSSVIPVHVLQTSHLPVPIFKLLPIERLQACGTARGPASSASRARISRWNLRVLLTFCKGGVENRVGKMPPSNARPSAHVQIRVVISLRLSRYAGEADFHLRGMPSVDTYSCTMEVGGTSIPAAGADPSGCRPGRRFCPCTTAVWMA